MTVTILFCVPPRLIHEIWSSFGFTGSRVHRISSTVSVWELCQPNPRTDFATSNRIYIRSYSHGAPSANFVHPYSYSDRNANVIHSAAYGSPDPLGPANSSPG